MNKKFIFAAVFLVLAGAVFGGLFGRLPVKSSADGTLTAAKITADYRESVRLIDAKYAGRINHEELAESSIQGMLWTLDPHSAFFTRAEFRKLLEEQASEFYGIGVSILRHRDGVYVKSVIPGTPADKSGIRYGDRFVEIEGKDATDWTSAEVSKNVRGTRGTIVNLKVERAGVKEPIEFNITRGGVPLPSIRNYFMLGSDIGYVGLSGGFQETTSEELEAAIAELRKKGMRGLILDLRGNPGGLLPQAIDVVGQFIPSGKTVVSVKGRSSYMTGRDLKISGGNPNDFPLVVMIDGGSASASEIVAGAVQDYGRGLVVGSNSFGKGLVQRVFRLPYGTGLTLTTARYYTPYGRSLQRDYSNGSIYEYYAGHAEEGEEDPEAVPTPEKKDPPKGRPVKTAGGRIYYGGRGIEPDLKAPPLAFTPLRARINEAAFFFTRQLVAGQIREFESFKTGKQNFRLTVNPGEFEIGEELYEAFVRFAVGDPEFGLTRANIDTQKTFARSRLRGEIATAVNSNEAGQQVLLETDPQVLKAIDAMPEAEKLLARRLTVD